MKICQLCAIDFTHYHLLANLHRALARRGHDVTLVSSDGPLLAPLRAEGLRVVPIPIGRHANVFAHAASVARLAALFRRERFDLVHVHTPVAALVGRAAARLAGVRCVAYTAHGFYFHERMPMTLRWAHIALERVAGRFTDLLLVQSAEDGAVAARLRIMPRDRILTIANGVTLARFGRSRRAATREELRSRFGIPLTASIVTTIGRLVPEKGYLEFFAAAERILTSGRGDVHFLAIGDKLASDRDDGLRREVARLAGDDALRRHVHLLGYRDDVPDLLGASDIFVLASFREGLPRCVIEAMASGLPVVGTRIRGVREEVVDEVTGTLVPPGDAPVLATALTRLLDDPGLARAWGEAGLARARQHYDEERVLALQIAALEDLIPRGTKRGA